MSVGFKETELVINSLVVVVQVVVKHCPPALPDKVAVGAAHGDLLSKVDRTSSQCNIACFFTSKTVPHTVHSNLFSLISGHICSKAVFNSANRHVFAPRV